MIVYQVRSEVSSKVFLSPDILFIAHTLFQHRFVTQFIQTVWPFCLRASVLFPILC
jgi:hypothetical protein